MANFRAHLTIGGLVAGTAAFASYAQGLSGSAATQGLFLLGTVASLLPDIDADDSKPVRAVFQIAGIVIGFLIAFRLAGRVGVVEQVLIWVAVASLVSFPLRWAFAHLTVHRGIWHSLLMAVTVALLVTVLADVLLGLSPTMAWLVGGFTLLGYLTHLTLDEIASVDLLDRKVKRSFGTAIKPFSLRAWPWTLALIGLAVVLVGITPDPKPLLTAVSQLGLGTERLAALWPRW